MYNHPQYEIEKGKNLSKIVKKVADKTLGIPMRSFMRNVVANPLFRINYAVTTVGDEHALSCTDGAIVISNHVSRLDGPFLMNEAWPFARIWATSWGREYDKVRFLMWVFSVIPLGSSRELPTKDRARRREKAMHIMNRVVRAGRHLLIFAEGGIGDGTTVKVDQKLSGVHDLIRDNPDKPVLMVRIIGLEKSMFGKRALRWYKRLRRLPVIIVLERFDNVALYGGPSSLNKRIEQYYNLDIPLATVPKSSAF